MAARSKARKRALDVLFEADQRARPVLEVLADRLERPGTQSALPQYSVDLVHGVVAEQERIDELLSTYSQGWTLARMPAVDRAVLRIGAWEVLFSQDVPEAVAVDEAVELARALSTDDSPAFVNGLLGRLVDSDRLGDVLAEQHLPCTDPQHGPVDGRHPGKGPPLGVGAEQLVDPFLLGDDAVHQVDRVLRQC